MRTTTRRNAGYSATPADLALRRLLQHCRAISRCSLPQTSTKDLLLVQRRARRRRCRRFLFVFFLSARLDRHKDGGQHARLHQEEDGSHEGRQRLGP